MDLQEESWDKVAECIRDCDHEQEAQVAALKIFEASGLLGNYLEAQDLEDGVSEILLKLESGELDKTLKTITLDWYNELTKWHKIRGGLEINGRLIH